VRTEVRTNPQKSADALARRVTHAFEVRPRKDHRGVDLISDALSFGRLLFPRQLLTNQEPHGGK
jgi:hypothetical protein